MIKQHDSDTVCLYSLGTHMTHEAPARSRMKRSAEQAAGSAVPVPPRGALCPPCCPTAPPLPQCPSLWVPALVAGAGWTQALHPWPWERGQEPSLPHCCSPALASAPPQGTQPPPRCSFAAGLWDAQACLPSWSCLPCSRGNVLLLKLSSYSLLLSPSLV